MEITKPLAGHKLVDTRSPEEAREAIGRIFCPHHLRPTQARAPSFHALHHSAPQDGYSVNFVAYGAEVEIDPGQLKDFYLLQWPTRGAARVDCGAERVEAASGRCASLLSPTLPTRMIWREGCEKVIALIRRDALQRQFEALADRPAPAVEFAAGVPMASPLGRQAQDHLQLMLSATQAVAAPAYQALLRDALSTLLLTGLPHNQTRLIEKRPLAASPGAVRRAEAYIVAHLGEPLAMADVARAAGASLRSLQESFREARGASLTAFVQRRRLEAFHRALCDRQAPASVTELAYGCGLGHLGRAAAAYRARYGESPRETLKRR